MYYPQYTPNYVPFFPQYPTTWVSSQPAARKIKAVDYHEDGTIKRVEYED